jgi:hypothetical protein
MRIVLDRFWKFAGEFSRFCPIEAAEGSRLTWRDRSFSPKGWSARRGAFALHSRPGVLVLLAPLLLA